MMTWPRAAMMVFVQADERFCLGMAPIDVFPEDKKEIFLKRQHCLARAIYVLNLRFGPCTLVVGLREACIFCAAVSSSSKLAGLGQSVDMGFRASFCWSFTLVGYDNASF